MGTAVILCVVSRNSFFMSGLTEINNSIEVVGPVKLRPGHPDGCPGVSETRFKIVIQETHWAT